MSELIMRVGRCSVEFGEGSWPLIQSPRFCFYLGRNTKGRSFPLLKTVGTGPEGRPSTTWEVDKFGISLIVEAFGKIPEDHQPEPCPIREKYEELVAKHERAATEAA